MNVFLPTDLEQKDIFDFLHRRHKKSSTFFVHSMSSMNGMCNSTQVQALWQMQSLIVSPMTVIVSIS